ncbi:hypothetical protein ACJX0J_031163, partial [Zea mays]
LHVVWGEVLLSELQVTSSEIKISAQESAERGGIELPICVVLPCTNCFALLLIGEASIAKIFLLCVFALHSTVCMFIVLTP